MPANLLCHLFTQDLWIKGFHQASERDGIIGPRVESVRAARGDFQKAKHSFNRRLYVLYSDRLNSLLLDKMICVIFLLHAQD